MDMHLTLVFSSKVEYSQKQEILSAAKAEWFFIRGPRSSGQLLSHAHFSPPELTETRFRSEDGFVQVLEKNCRLEDELVDWSRKFPDVKFAFLEADGRGKIDKYSGYTCQNGKKLKVQDPDRLGHMKLLSDLAIRIEKFFPPLEPGYFEDSQ